jgi:hypothetical protein
LGERCQIIGWRIGRPSMLQRATAVPRSKPAISLRRGERLRRAEPILVDHFLSRIVTEDGCPTTPGVGSGVWKS